MATRAPKSPQRSGGGAGAKKRSSPAKGAAAARRPASGRKAPPKKPVPNASDGPIALLFVWVGKCLLLVWKVLAHTVGGLARAMGRSARDLDPDLRRDGVGLVLLALGLLIAAAVWWDTDGDFLEVTRMVVMGSFGTFSPVLPLLFLPFAWRLMRTPGSGDAPDIGRLFIGYSALMVGLLGLIHIGQGIPWPSDGQLAIRRAGGIIGFAASGPLSQILTPWVTGILLLMLMLFGLLVVTATPIYRIPDRLRQLFGGMMARDDSPDSGVDILDERPASKPRRRTPRRPPRTERSSTPSPAPTSAPMTPPSSTPPRTSRRRSRAPRPPPIPLRRPRR